jgi:hypothetical protein
VRRTIRAENARLMNECGANCTLADMRRIDQQMVRLETAATLAAISQTTSLTTAQALQLAELVASLHPLYVTPIALYQAIWGQGVLTQTELSAAERFFNGVAAAIPVGSATYQVVRRAAAQAEIEAQVLRAKMDNNFYAEGASIAPAGLNTSAGVIAANPHKTTTVLGRWSPDMQSVIGDATKVTDGQLNPGGALAKTEDFGAKPGGFNVLNVPKAVEEAAGTLFFEKVNKPFLDEAIKRGDDIALGTIPAQAKDVIDVETGALIGNFAKELDYLARNNYKPVNISPVQWEKIKGWFK